jgi:NAD-dependent deacetylase
LDEIFAALGRCTVFVAIGTSGMVEPAASFVAQVCDRARTYYVGPDLPANAADFDKCFQEKAGVIVPGLFAID